VLYAGIEERGRKAILQEARAERRGRAAAPA
jgi:hypothetical protein